MGRQDITRRGFIGAAAAGLFSAGLGLPRLHGKGLGQDAEGGIVYRTLGRTGLRIPIVSYGVMNSDNPDLLRKAIDMGVKHLDTANVYLRGNSEAIIGKTLEEDGTRDKVYIGTKMRFARDNDRDLFQSRGSASEPLATKENFQKQLETSLRRLRTDRVDILYLHSCYSPEMVLYEPMMEELVKSRKEGKARFIGVSTHKNEPSVIRAAAEAGVYDVVLTAYTYLLERREAVKEAIQYAASKGIGIVAMKTHGGVRRGTEGGPQADPAAAYKWVLSDENVCTTIPGMTAFEHLDFNFKVMNDYALSLEERRALERASAESDPLYCQACRACIPSCPLGVEIPNLMRAFMYAEGYGNLIQAEMTIGALPKKKSLSACAACGGCAASCRRGIDIGSRVGSLIGLGLA